MSSRVRSMCISGFLREGAHGGPGVGVLEAIDKHVIKQFGVPESLAFSPGHQNLGRVRHALKATTDDQLVGAGGDAVDAKNGGLHAAAAGLVDRDRAGGARDAGREHGLPRRALLEARRQHAAHEHLIDCLGRHAGALQRGGNRGGAQFIGCGVGEVAQQSAHRRAGTIDNQYIGHGVALNRYEGGHLARTASTLQVQSGLAFTANDLSRTAVRNAEGVSPVCSRNMRLK